jgi:hypothetical protein
MVITVPFWGTRLPDSTKSKPSRSALIADSAEWGLLFHISAAEHVGFWSIGGVNG